MRTLHEKQKSRTDDLHLIMRDYNSERTKNYLLLILIIFFRIKNTPHKYKNPQARTSLIFQHALKFSTTFERTFGVVLSSKSTAFEEIPSNVKYFIKHIDMKYC